MRSKRFRHTSLIELAILSLIVVVLAGAGIAAEFNGSERANPGSATPPSASPRTETTPAVGEVIALPSSESGELTLVRTDKPAAFSQQEAMRIVRDSGVPFGLGGEWLGRPITVSAAYGLGTFGRPGGPGLPWLGDRNIPLKGTDVVLDHIENRPMWILDYDNAYAHGTQVDFKHAVYAVDEETRSVLLAWFYEPVP